MTEITDKSDLPAPVERFILQWGDMGTAWGVNRSVSQIHALLYLSERPLTAEEISQTLEMARSNVSNSLKELMGWDLIRRVPIRGDRRDHFEAETDIWEIVSRIAAGRKERELDPAFEVLARCVDEAKADRFVHPVALQRLREMQEFTALVDRWYSQMLRVPKTKLAIALKLGARIIDFLPKGRGRKQENQDKD